MIGMNFTYLSKMENDRLGTTPSTETLVGMAEALKVDRDWLLTECGRLPERLTRSISENPEFFQRIGKLHGRQLEAALRQPYRLAGQVSRWSDHGSDRRYGGVRRRRSIPTRRALSAACMRAIQ